MRLDSARDLKQSLVSAVLSSPALAVPLRAMGVSARPLTMVSHPGTVALGIARRKEADFALAVRVQQRGLEDSSLLDRIQKRACGEVDVRYIGRVVKQEGPWHQRKNRPLRIGGSIGHFKITAGTLGCFVRARGADAGELLILSNNHVLANENRARKGQNILQPAALDKGMNPDDAVARLKRFVRLKRTGANKVDCAVASLVDGIGCLQGKLLGLGKLAGLGEGLLGGEKVAKVGRTTGLTRGRVAAFELDNVVVNYDIGDLRFDDQIEVDGVDDTPFSRGGDSGSMIVNADRQAVALLFAGSDTGGSSGLGLTYANSMRTVLDALKVDLVS